MKVSIIIPVYNTEKYLQESIESALNQTYSNIEVIAVDDGSTDNSPAILKKYEGKIKIITKENGGVASALNAGIKEMTGEWFKWLSADDILYSHGVKELISEAEKLEDKKHTILYGNFDYINPEGKIIQRGKEPNHNELSTFDVNVILLDHHIGNDDTSLIHKSTIDDFGMFNEKIDHEDYELRLRYCILHNCRLRYVPKTIAKYRIHRGQLTKEKVITEYEQTDKIRKSIFNELSPDERVKYQEALKKFRKSKPLNEKSRYFIKKMLRIMPPTISNFIVSVYYKTKGR